MMKRETILGYKRVVHKFSYYPSVQRELSLMDSHLEALDRIAELEAELAEADKNLEYWANR